MSSQIVRALCLALALIPPLAACSPETVNKPISDLPRPVETPTVPTGGYRPAALASNDSSRELLVLLAFSGGGKRSAAFSYGVLRGLRDFRITVEGREGRLLDELDTIAAVSGGSFTAAYYGLHRDMIFTDFERDFLKRDIEAYVWGVHFLPWRWEWSFYRVEQETARNCLRPSSSGNSGNNAQAMVGSIIQLYCMFDASFSTNSSEAMAMAYDELMFHGATFADLARTGKPFISINATDVNYGKEFAFSQDMFDLICSDLSSFPVALAVAASNGHPLLFTPITLENHAQKCALREPGWLKRAASGGPHSRERYLAEFARMYLDPYKTHYVHLMDGGIADSLAMRYLIGTALQHGEDGDAIRRAGRDRVRRIVLISADGQGSNGQGGHYDYHVDPRWRLQRAISSLSQFGHSVFGARNDGYNAETLTLANDELTQLVETLRRVRCEEGAVIDGYPCKDVEGYLVHLSLSDIPDEKVREQLQQIPIALTIPDEAVDQLVSIGETLVRDSTVLAEFRSSLERQPEATVISSR